MAFLSHALAKVLQDFDNENKVDIENKVHAKFDNEQDAEQDSEMKSRTHVANGNSYVTNSGNSKSHSDVTQVAVLLLLLFVFEGYGGLEPWNAQ